jgi:hypothetical protein
MALTKPRAYQIYDIDYKQAVRVVSTANVTLSGGAPNSVDGVGLSLNDRVLVTGQSNKSQNGIYYVTTVGSGSNGTWARSVDANTTGEVLAGMIVMVTEGGQYADTQWKLLTDDPITIGVTELTFAQNFGVPYTAASVPPTANVVVGSQWFNTGTNVLYEYMYDGTSYYWIDLTGPSIGTNGVMEGSVLANGNSNVSVNFNGNINATISGTNVVTWAPAGEYVAGNISATGAIYSNYNTNTANTGSFMATGSNTKGGTGYLDFLVAQNTSGGATNPYKWLRVNSTGGLEVINSAYTSTLMILTDAGAMSVSGSYQVNGKQAVNGPAFRAYIAVNQAITSGSQQKVTFGSETFDTNGNFASSTFTPTVEGYYQLNATVRMGGTSGTGEIMITIWKNGSEYARGTNESGTEQGAGWYSMQVSDIAYANGTGDYFEIYIQQTSGSNKDTTAGQNISYFSGAMVRGA